MRVRGQADGRFERSDRALPASGGQLLCLPDRQAAAGPCTLGNRRGSVLRHARPRRRTSHHQEQSKSNHVYKLVEVVGSSPVSTDDAIRNAIGTAAKTLRRIEWFQVIETRGHVADGQVAHFQVTLKVGFRLET